MKEFRFTRTTPKMVPTPPPETKVSESLAKSEPNETELSSGKSHSDDIDRDPYRRECEFEPGYDWRTDPYYTESAIRERMKATKAKVQPVSVNDTKE